jgi:hypothetical protein
MKTLLVVLRQSSRMFDEKTYFVMREFVQNWINEILMQEVEIVHWLGIQENITGTSFMKSYTHSEKCFVLNGDL